MIARTWSGRVPPYHADRFEEHLMATGVAESAKLPGHLGAHVLRADTDAYVEFRLITYWESWDAIRAFAGEHVGVAVLYPGDEEYELNADPHVEHHRVVRRTQQ
jgi:heme-degrading monooxygenase HmoA